VGGFLRLPRLKDILTDMETMRQLAVRNLRDWFAHTGRLAVCVTLACLFVGPVQFGHSSPKGKVIHLDIRGLELLLQSDPNLLLIDVRSPEELAGPLGKIPQSRNVTMREIENNPEQFPRNKTLVLICSTGPRSSTAADLLADHGYVVYVVRGGMQAWRKLHPQASEPAKEAPSPNNASPGSKDGSEKPSPRENENQTPPEKTIFENNMGC
jgi:rhodanese-related sulfurtransferase